MNPNSIINEPGIQPPSPKKTVVIFLPRCPACASVNLLTYRSRTTPVGNLKTRYIRCRDCAWRFTAILR